MSVGNRAWRDFLVHSRVARVMWICLIAALPAAPLAESAGAAETDPPAVKMPGTQPREAGGIESVSRCDNCHGDFPSAGEPWFNWAASMMAHASRDPLFWATVAVAEQDFDGAGDLCIRCHTPEGWLDGRSTPTDGSGLAAGDDDGVQCDVCHRLVSPDGAEHPGVQNSPFLAHDEGSPPTGYFGGGMYVIEDGKNKLGPYSDAEATHQFMQSEFHRGSEICGTCHDVSNPVVGDLAHNHGAQQPLAPGTYSGDPASPVEQKAAFNNFPYQYGIVERTFSEHMASLFPQTPVSGYSSLPLELRTGAIQRAYEAALLAGTGGNYEDGTPRHFTCQSCHMRPVVGQGCDKNPPVRSDLPLHDLTGGNYWVPDAMQHLDASGLLRLGGGLTGDQINALDLGKVRALQNLQEAATLGVADNLLTVVNLTGHKLISGYPEGRRMWLNVKWYDATDALIAEDGAYGPITVAIDGAAASVETLLDLHDPYAPIYEAHGAISQEWAVQLLALGWDPDLPLSFDRVFGSVTTTLGDLGARDPGSYQETFHFVLNNLLAKDNRIPPWGMDYDEAKQRNILPVPASQYGDPGPGGTYRHWDEVALNPPPGADHASIQLLYQPTSWEYIQFLDLANTGAVGFLADEGRNLRDAWLATGMAAPRVMASAVWQLETPACADGLDNDGDGAADYPSDPGCTSGVDESENILSVACDDRLDGDGDGFTDFPRDPGCPDPSGTLENPQCQDGVNNDGALGTDFDGGESVLGIGNGDPDGPDPQCVDQPWKNREKPRKRTCGIGAELSLLAAGLLLLRRRRERRRVV
jgi:hypothetical protein